MKSSVKSKLDDNASLSLLINPFLLLLIELSKYLQGELNTYSFDKYRPSNSRNFGYGALIGLSNNYIFLYLL